MVLIQACRTYSRDTLLAINGQSRCAIGQSDRDVISHLQLHRRGRRAGDHQRRRAFAAHSVTLSVSQPSTAGEIPTVIGNRGQSNVNTGQLFNGYRDARVRIHRTVHPGLTNNSAAVKTLNKLVLTTQYRLCICSTPLVWRNLML